MIMKVMKRMNTMIEFKKHDGMLFKMLDEPVPLTPDAEIPCLVRFRMPFSKRFRGKHEGVAFFCDAIKKNPLYGNRLYAYETRRVGCIAEPRELEIIGYPVADGSKEWALYQMMQGEAVTFFDQPNRILRLVNGYIQDSISDGFWNRRSGNEFLSYASSPGWQIYEEPKPTFKVGDWVKYGIDTYLRVIEASGAERTSCKTLSGTILYPYTSCLSKIDPSEVKVKLELIGKVRKIEGNNRAFELIDEDGVATVIGWQQIKNPTTRSLVESLLKAQKEEEE
jgi:hypothetical protein